MKLYKIKHCLILLLMAILPLASFANQELSKVFAKGNALYAKGKYEEASKLYQSVIDKGYQSAALFYNAGNANFKTGDLPTALLYYEKAHQLNPADEDIKANIRFVNARSTDKIEVLPEFFLSKWWNSLLFSYSLSQLSSFSLVMAFAAAALLICYFFAHRGLLKRFAFYTAVTLFMLTLFLVFIGNRQLAYFSNHQEAIVFSSTVMVKAAPSENAKSLFVIHEGTKVLWSEKDKGWAKIRLGNGTEGWMKEADFKEI